MTAARKIVAPPEPLRMSWVAMSLPTVLATSELNRAPMKFSTAPKTIALAGESTRVEITVATALAASFHPLARLKTSANTIVRIKIVNDKVPMYSSLRLPGGNRPRQFMRA